jgi:uncharacterized protein with HEPN domain
VRGDRDRLHDILDAIARIRKYSDEGRERFEQDELVQTWIVHHLTLLGEAVGRLSEGLREKYPAPWKEVIGMRNILIHEYFRVDPEIVWAVVERDLATLEAQVRHLLEGEAL